MAVSFGVPSRCDVAFFEPYATSHACSWATFFHLPREPLKYFPLPISYFTVCPETENIVSKWG